ncbi:sensor histidine kinase [Deinococcus cellulosilyticus]|uniref:histidine kinase n=1 Tax=Deinococcus cellulosilyticus (strain DSM 18568 / NBRC 106333 / KACC 11606 / 5516J-15) TaxID=1223518 RepID=A0A511MWK4_DEIC1|nr:HAMP domain-containing sensor histidine kinase [Deinococcus cellulosilyticus]GEM44496.1 two-component sensor histidine kinase [Deinococcus cellulosilyticus NBRC 106333 = KACC 11606]
MTLRQRLAVFIAVTTLVALVIQGGLGYFSLQHQVYASLDRDLNIYVQRLTGLLRKKGLSTDPRFYQDINAGYEGYITRVRLVHEGQVIWQYGQFPDDIPMPNLTQYARNYGQWRVGTWTIHPSEGEEVDFFIQGAILSRELNSSLSNYQQTMLLTTLLVTLLGVIFALLLSRPALKPLQHLLDTTRKIASSGDLSLKVPQEGGGELGELSATFNHMLDRLAGFRKRETEFTRNASHELRTPLTAMKLHLGNWKAGYATPEETLEIICEEVDRMARLSESLLTLAREGRTQKTEFDLAELVQEITGARDLPYSGPEHCQVCGDPLLLRQALLNLLTNAQHHAPAASVGVSLHTTTEHNQTFGVLRVADTGPGMGEEALSRATETFYRAPGTRAPGSGLGLSVVAQVAELHGGKVVLSQNTPHGLVVELWVQSQG